MSENDTDGAIGARGSASNVMAGKRGLVLGVANDHSIAWGIARVLAKSGASLAFTFQGESAHFRNQKESRL